MSRRRKNALLQRFEYLLYRGVAGIAASFSEERARRWGTRLGNIARRVLRGRDRLAMRNLAAAFPERSSTERRRILDECWRHFGRETLSYLRVQRLDPAAIPALCRASGTDLLDEAIAHGRGVMMISAHFGSWEIGGLAIMALVDNVRTVARPLDNELLERDLARIRARTGAQVLDRRRAARPLFKTLSENGAVVLLVDQAVIPREGVLVPFLGRPAWTTDAPAKLALRLGSRIVIAFCIPDSTGHRLEFEELIRLEELGNDERTPEALTTRINDVISRRIAARPELWLWMHDRWKGSVTGESENKTPDAE
jgi:KDO2-lipid IV(A) lauroyltransferase